MERNMGARQHATYYCWVSGLVRGYPSPFCSKHIMYISYQKCPEGVRYCTYMCLACTVSFASGRKKLYTKVFSPLNRAEQQAGIRTVGGKNQCLMVTYGGRRLWERGEEAREDEGGKGKKRASATRLFPFSKVKGTATFSDSH